MKKEMKKMRRKSTPVLPMWYVFLIYYYITMLGIVTDSSKYSLSSLTRYVLFFFF